MPARKSNASVADDESGLSVEDLNLPKTMVNRLAKGALPANFNVQAVAQSAISKSATVFVNYLTAHASDIAARQNKKTIQPKDVLDALKELEFEMFVKRTNEELIKYTEIQCTKRNSYRRRVKDEKRAQGESGDASGVMGPDGSMMSVGDDGGAGLSSSISAGSNGAARTTNGHTAAGAEPAAKRVRMDADVEDDDEQDVDGDEGEGEGEGEDEADEDEVQDEEEEDEEEDEEGDVGEREDLLEERQPRQDEDEAMDGEESD